MWTDLHADIMLHTNLPALGDVGDRLKSELTDYKALAVGVAAGTDLCQFWRTHGVTLPTFNAGARVAAAINPSSAAAERVFAQLSWMFTDAQTSTLQDYKRLSLILRYNELWRLKVKKAKSAWDALH